MGRNFYPKREIADFGVLILIGLGTLIAIWRFWQPGISSAADMLMGIYRVFELDWAWRNQSYFPRLGMNLNFTYTAPLFQYYPPLVSYGTLVFLWSGLGFVEAAKAMFTVTLLLAGLGMYVLAHHLLADRRAAVVSATAYIFAPYVLANIYERGATAESLALALLPWTLWGFHRLQSEQDRKWVWVAALLLASLVLAHNITALFAMPLIVAYLVFSSWRQWHERQIFSVGVALSLGLTLCAFYWLPALFEQSYVRIETTMLTQGLRPEDHLTAVNALIQPQWAFDYWGPLRFRMALWQAVLGAVAVLGIVIQLPRRRIVLGFFAGVIVLLLLLQLETSKLIWQTITLARFIQFPWRLLGIVSFCAALLIGSVFCWRRLAGRMGLIVAVLLITLIIGASTYYLTPERSKIWYEFSSPLVDRTDLFERGRFGFDLFSDYSPIWATQDSRDLVKPRPFDSTTLPPLPTVPAVRVIEASPLSLKLQVKTQLPFPLRLHRIYFPGWQVYVNGQSLPTKPDGSLIGLVTTELPIGEYDVLIRFGETPLRLVADGLSFLSLLVVVIGLMTTRGCKRLVFGLGAMFVLLAGMAFFHQGLGKPPVRPVEYVANLQDEIWLLGYHLPQTVFSPGDTLSLQLYWFAQKTPSDDYTVLLHLVKPDDSAVIAQGDSAPIGGYSPTTRWEPGEIIADEQQIYLDKAIMPGTYQLLVGMYDAQMKNLEIFHAPQVLPGNRILLATIEIKEK